MNACTYECADTPNTAHLHVHIHAYKDTYIHTHHGHPDVPTRIQAHIMDIHRFTHAQMHTETDTRTPMRTGWATSITFI